MAGEAAAVDSLPPDNRAAAHGERIRKEQVL